MHHVSVDDNSEINLNGPMTLSHKSGAVLYPVSRLWGYRAHLRNDEVSYSWQEEASSANRPLVFWASG
jgi:hypothetical protein